MTDPTPITYTVTCCSTLLYRTTFEVEARTKEEAIDLCNNRTTLSGDYLEPVSEKFLETMDESEWEAEPL